MRETIKITDAARAAGVNRRSIYKFLRAYKKSSPSRGYMYTDDLREYIKLRETCTMAQGKRDGYRGAMGSPTINIDIPQTASTADRKSVV